MRTREPDLFLLAFQMDLKKKGGGVSSEMRTQTKKAAHLLEGFRP